MLTTTQWAGPSPPAPPPAHAASPLLHHYVDSTYPSYSLPQPPFLMQKMRGAGTSPRSWILGWTRKGRRSQRNSSSRILCPSLSAWSLPFLPPSPALLSTPSLHSRSLSLPPFPLLPLLRLLLAFLSLLPDARVHAYTPLSKLAIPSPPFLSLARSPLPRLSAWSVALTSSRARCAGLRPGANVVGLGAPQGLPPQRQVHGQVQAAPGFSSLHPMLLRPHHPLSSVQTTRARSCSAASGLALLQGLVGVGLCAGASLLCSEHADRSRRVRRTGLRACARCFVSTRAHAWS